MIIKDNELSIYEVESLFQSILNEFDNGSVILDMKNVKKVDMSIIQLFISAKKSCLEDSKEFKLSNVSQGVSKILKNCSCEFLLGEAS